MKTIGSSMTTALTLAIGILSFAIGTSRGQSTAHLFRITDASSIQVPLADFFGAIGGKSVDYQSALMRINHACFMCYQEGPQKVSTLPDFKHRTAPAFSTFK